MSNNTIVLKQNIRQVLNIIEGLQFYKDNLIKPKYKFIIDDQLSEMEKQLQVQNVNIFVNDLKPRFVFGDQVRYKDEDAIIVGMSNEEEFIKIVICQDNQLKLLDVPIVLLSNIICP